VAHSTLTSLVRGNMKEQEIGKEYTFIDTRTGNTDTGVLPLVYGQSNQFALWRKRPKSLKYINGGYWYSRLFCNQRKERWKTGESGLLGRMKHLLYRQRWNAEERGYKPPNITAEQMLRFWIDQKGLCAACNGELQLLDSAFDHNHETGEPRGFLHQQCNLMEGHLAKMTREARESFIDFIRGVNMAKHDSCYDQVSIPSAGTTTPVGKASGDIKNDALGNPSRFTRNQTTVATEEHDVKKLREEQLGSNGYQSNGYCGGEDSEVAPRRGFKQS